MLRYHTFLKHAERGNCQVLEDIEQIILFSETAQGDISQNLTNLEKTATPHKGQCPAMVSK